MRRLYAFVVLLFFVQGLYSKPNTKISGKISNAVFPTFVIQLKDYQYKDSTIKVLLDEEGRFTTSFKLSKFICRAVFDLNGRIFEFSLQSEDSLVIEFDARNIETTIHFQGRGSERNNFIAEYNKAFGLRDVIMLQKIKDLPYNDFYNYRLMNKEKEFQLLDKYKETVGLDDFFYRYERAKIDYQYNWDLLRYSWVHEFYGGNKKTLLINQKVVKELVDNGPPLNSAAQLNDPFYINYLIEYFNNLYLLNISKDSAIIKLDEALNNDYLAFLNSKSSELLKGEVLDFYQKKVLPKIKYIISTKDISNDYHLFSLIFKYLTSGKESLYNPLLQLNNIADNIVLYSLDGDSKIKLSQVIEKAKGKIIYFDFWTTWCGACISSIPYSNQLQNSFNNPDVIFINICFGKDEHLQQWMNIVSQKGWEGEHYFYNGRYYDSPLNKTFDFGNGFPNYIIVNEKGYMIHANSSDCAKFSIERYIDMMNKLKN